LSGEGKRKKNFDFCAGAVDGLLIILNIIAGSRQSETEKVGFMKNNLLIP
jgi:hypothetical protein